MLGTRRQTVRFPISPAASLVVSDCYYPLASAPAAFWAVVRSDGGDIRVTTQDGTTQCAREVVGFDYANKTGSLFFSPGSGTAFYVCAGSGDAEPDAASAYGSRAVWDSDYACVMHMSHDGANLSVNDSTGKNSLENFGATLITGKVGQGADFSSTAYVDLGNADELKITGALTLSAWCYPINASTFRGIVGKTDAEGLPAPFDWYLVSNSGLPRLLRGGASGFGNVTAAVRPNHGQWNHLAVSMVGGAGTEVVHYLNGSANGSGNLTMTGSVSDANKNARIGRRADGGTQYYGGMDEIRVSKVVRGAAVIAQHYANENDPAAFWTTGAAS